MKILHVANRAEKYKANRYYGLPYKMNNGFVRNGHCVYWFSDRDIARANALLPSRKFGQKAANRVLLEVCEHFRPDAVVIAHADVIGNQTLAAIKSRYGVPIIQYNIDPFHEHNISILKSRNGFVDCNVMTTGGSVLKRYAEKGTRYAFMPNPVDPSIDCLENFRHADLAMDAIFVGQTENFVVESDLRTKIPRLVEDLPGLAIGLKNGVWGHSYLELLATVKMGLNLSIFVSPEGESDGDGSHHYLYSSDRISQYLGNGLLTFAEKRFCLGEVYGPDCIEEVGGYEELKDRLQYFARHDDLRRKRAENSWRRTHAEFNERLVAQYLLEVGLGGTYSHPYCWPTQVWG